MKKLIAIVLAVSLVLTLVLGSGLALADKPGNDDDGYNGNGAPSGAHYNLNIIGVPHDMNGNFKGGNGSRIFVDRTGTTKFYVQGGGSYEIRDHDGTDGEVGTGPNPGAVGYEPGIIFPYDGDADPTWRVQIWVRLVGPKGSEVNWKSSYWDGIDTWVKWADFDIQKSSKFSLKTGQLLMDGWEDILWELTPKTKFRNLQMRIFLLD